MKIEDRVLRALFNSRGRLALHEFKLADVSQRELRVSLGALESQARVKGTIRIGRPFKEWRLTELGRARVETNLAANAVSVQPEVVQ